MLAPQDDWIEPVISSVPPLTVVEPLYKLTPASTRSPPPPFTRFTLPVPLPCVLLRITPANVQSAALLTVSVLSAFKPVLSYSPSIVARLLPLMEATVCACPFNSKRA